MDNISLVLFCKDIVFLKNLWSHKAEISQHPKILIYAIFLGNETSVQPHNEKVNELPNYVVFALFYNPECKMHDFKKYFKFQYV
jgi:hypothetical protein